jgi:predicted extracellular nuclease
MKKFITAAAMVAALAGAGSADASLFISQVYGGGGATGTGATYYDYDYIELFNNGPAAVSLNGYSVQYNSATGVNAWSTTTLSGSIAAYGYFLIREGSASAAFTNALPVSDLVGASGTGATGLLNLSATAGKVALVNGTAALAANNASPVVGSFVDLIGYGTTANNTTGNLVSSAVSNQTAVLRSQNGLGSTFTVGTPTPHNSLSATNVPTPTPIPAAAWLLGSGLLGLVGMRRRNS